MAYIYIPQSYSSTGNLFIINLLVNPAIFQILLSARVCHAWAVDITPLTLSLEENFMQKEFHPAYLYQQYCLNINIKCKWQQEW